MEKGAMIGRGMTAEVYEWGPDKVLKLFFKKFGEERIKREAEIGRKIHEAGIPSPEVFGVVDVDGRKGIIFERIFGDSISERLKTEPWMLYHYSKKLAKLQYRIHLNALEQLPSQMDRFTTKIDDDSPSLKEKRKTILDYVEGLPDGNSVCHGDIHFNNVIVSGGQLIAIDWNSAYKGNPAGDVARTFLMITAPWGPKSIPDVIRAPYDYVQKKAGEIYLKEYMKLSKSSYQSIDEWMLPVAATRVKEKAENKKWFMKIINRRLKEVNEKDTMVEHLEPQEQENAIPDKAIRAILTI